MPFTRLDFQAVWAQPVLSRKMTSYVLIRWQPLVAILIIAAAKEEVRSSIKREMRVTDGGRGWTDWLNVNFHKGDCCSCSNVKLG